MFPNSTSDIEPTKTIDLSPGGAVREYRPAGAGWGCVLRYEKKSKLFSGAAKSKSEFRMELLGIVIGLKHLKCPCIVNLHIATERLIHCADQLLRPRKECMFLSVTFIMEPQRTRTFGRNLKT
jgi:ribonuclease HI